MKEAVNYSYINI